MAETYYYNDGGSCESRQATFTYQTMSSYYEDKYDSCCGNFRDTWEDWTYRATINSAASENIDIWFEYTIIYDDPWNHSEDTYQNKVTITAGNTYADFVFDNYNSSFYQDFCPGGGCALETTQTIDVAIIEQPVIPTVCNDPGCIMAITGYTGTTPSTRGDNDATISVGLSGVTGTTVTYKINGNTATLSGSTTGYTYTGLTAGIYEVLVLDGACFDQFQYTILDGEFRSGPFSSTLPTTVPRAVENPIILTLNTATSSSSPAQSINTFSIDGSISGVSISFSLYYPYIYEAIFESKGFPDRNTYFLESTLTDKVGTPVGTNTADEIATSLAEVIQKDAIISRLYYITSSGNTVTLKSKEYGDGYDLSVTNVSIVGSNVTLTNTQAGVAQYDGQLVESYSLYSELFVDEYMEYGDTPDPNDFIRILELELPFNKTNIHQFDMSSSLKNYVQSPLIDLTTTGLTYLNDYISTYYIKFGEKYPLISNTTTKKKRYKGQTGYGYCCNAALNYEDENDMTIYFGTNFPDTGSTSISGVTFLNTAPSTKYSHRDGKEYLYFVYPKNYPNAINLIGKIYMYDGTEYSNVILTSITTGGTNNYGGVACLPVDYTTLGLSSYETSGEKIRKVDLQLYQTISGVTGYTYSTLASYYFNIDEQPDNFNVVFLSKLGTYETFTFVGEFVQDQDVERSEYQVPYEVDAQGAATKGFEYNSILDTDYTKKYVVNTGILDAQNYNYVLGVLQSNKIFRHIGDEINYLVPTAQTATKSTNNNEFSLQITFKETISENIVTK